MERDKKKKTFNGKRKVGNDRSFEEKKAIKKLPKITSTSFSKNTEPKHLSNYNIGYCPIYLYDGNIKNFENKTKIKEDNYLQSISEKMDKLKQLNREIDVQTSKKDNILEFLKEIDINISNMKKIILEKNNEYNYQDIIIGNINQALSSLKMDENKCTMHRDAQKKIYENTINNKPNDILNSIQEIEKEKNILSNMQIENNENKKKIPISINNIQNKEQEINEELLEKEKKIQEKKNLKEQYDKVNQIAINDNKFCHDNFYSLLTFFPYYKNVAFINYNNKDVLNKETEEKKVFDENRIITEEELENDFEKENLENIKIILNQRENYDKSFPFKILKDRRTLQINLKEKYKFKKIFSIINNNYIAEPWDQIKYTSLKLSTINSYFNEFNMTAISNNYFVIYFVPILDKISIDNVVYKLYQKIKNNEYIDKNIMIKISAITENSYINLQNGNQENKIVNQLLSIKNANTYIIYGFLYEFTKTNRLNKKNIFRIYNFDYSYPQAIDMMKNISKYYAKKKRKKTGVYKKVTRKGQGKQKKKQNIRSTSNNNNINNKFRGKSIINNNKKNNINKVQFKKTINNFPTSGNIKRNNSSISNVEQMNKSFNSNKNNKNLNTSINLDNKNSKKSIKNNINVNSKKIKSNKREINNISEDKKILKKSGTPNNSQNKKSKDINMNNNLGIVKLDEKIKASTPRKNNSTNKKSIKKQKISSLVFNDLKLIKPEHTLVIHDINADFVNSSEFKQIAKACGILNNSEK